jgi:hypothetical protein
MLSIRLSAFLTLSLLAINLWSQTLRPNSQPTLSATGPVQRPTPANQSPTDISPHKVSFITVAPGVKLEVLDWGGPGRPLVLLAGLGDTAHIFDQFAPKLTSNYHVPPRSRRSHKLHS